MGGYEIPRARRCAWRRRCWSPWLSRAALAGIAFLACWHFVPSLRMRAVERPVRDLEAYRRAHGRFPMTEAELRDAVHGSRTTFEALLDAEPSFGGDCLHGTHLKYDVYDGGANFTLHFNQDCFCDGLDTSRYEYDSSDGTWFHWCD